MPLNLEIADQLVNDVAHAKGWQRLFPIIPNASLDSAILETARNFSDELFSTTGLDDERRIHALNGTSIVMERNLESVPKSIRWDPSLFENFPWLRGSIGKFTQLDEQGEPTNLIAYQERYPRLSSQRPRFRGEWYGRTAFADGTRLLWKLFRDVRMGPESCDQPPDSFIVHTFKPDTVGGVSSLVRTQGILNSFEFPQFEQIPTSKYTWDSQFKRDFFKLDTGVSRTRYESFGFAPWKKPPKWQSPLRLSLNECASVDLFDLGDRAAQFMPARG